MKLLLTFLSLLLGVSIGYKFMCPDTSQWALRGRHICKDPLQYYHCVLDGNTNLYKEICAKYDRRRHLTGPGRRVLIHGDFDSEFCSKDLYQPFRFLSNVSSDCMYKKSLCNEEGQLVYNNSDPVKDSKCTCDYNRGYDFVTRPSNPCYCIPSEEDCSCYLNPCLMSEFESDSRCINSTKSKIQNTCLRSRGSSKEDRRNVTVSNVQEKYSDNYITPVRENEKIIPAIVATITFFVGFVLMVLLDEICRKVYVIDDLIDMSCIEGDECILKCELSRSNVPVYWYKDDEDIENCSDIEKKCEGRFHRLTIKSMSRSETGHYQLRSGLNRDDILTGALIRCIVLPAALKQVSENDKMLYMNIIKTGTEVRHYIRILILGKNKVGKSCLLRRLLGEKIDDVQSTDGIDIVVKRCKIRLSDGKWMVDEATNGEDDDLVRIKTVFEGKTFIQNTPKPTKDLGTSIENTPKPTKDLGTSIQNTPKPTEDFSLVVDKPDSDDEMTQNHSENTENEKSGIVTSMTHADIDEDKSDEKDAYNQPSTSSNGLPSDEPPPDIAELTEKLSNIHRDVPKDLGQIKTDLDFDSIESYMDFWFDNIHSHRVVDTNMRQKTKLDPPVIVVGTGTDKCKDKSELEKKKEAFKKLATNKDRNRKHLRQICYVSNTKPDDKEFSDLREAIFRCGKSLRTFSEELPLRWIQLEMSFESKRKDRKNVLSWFEVYYLSRHCGIDDPMEILLFLKYQHKVGSIIYFESITDYVIINPRWLANAFRCLITNKFNFDPEYEFSDEMKELRENGKLEDSLVQKLFTKEPALEFNKHREYILKIMEVFDTIFKPYVNLNGVKQKTTSYYMPCMIQNSISFDDVYKEFIAKSYERSPWLCIEFEFLPLSFFNSILVHFMKNKSTCFKPNKEPTIYRSKGVFFMDTQERIKIFVCFCKDTVGIQLGISEETTYRSKCEEILSDVTKVIEDLKTKYEAKQIGYTIKAICSEGEIHDKTYRMSFQKLKEMDVDGTYQCHVCNKLHKSIDMYETWFKGYTKGGIEDHRKKILQTSYPFLTKNIHNVEAVCVFLQGDEVLTFGMVESIKNINPKPSAQVRELLNVLPRRGERAYGSFVDALIKTENQDAADYLRSKEASTGNTSNVIHNEDVKDPRFQRRCFKCKMDSSVYWCDECMEPLCDNCSRDHDSQHMHHLEHKQDKYKLHDNIRVKGSFSDIKAINNDLVCITQYSSEELLIVDIDKSTQRVMQLPGCPFRLVVIDSNTLALTLNNSTRIVMIYIKDGKIIKYIDVKEQCGGITWQRNLLVVGCYDKTLREFSRAGALKRTIPIDFIPDCICSCHDDKIFGVDNENVYCIDTNGKCLFIFHDVGAPCSITLDDTGYALVVCRYSRNILRMSPDGEQYEVIVNKILEPVSIPYISFMKRSEVPIIVLGSDETIDLYKQIKVKFI